MTRGGRTQDGCSGYQKTIERTSGGHKATVTLAHDLISLVLFTVITGQSVVQTQRTFEAFNLILLHIILQSTTLRMQQMLNHILF